MDFNTFVFEHNIDQIKNFWIDLYGTEKLQDDETIRIVPQIKREITENGVTKDSQLIFTANNQINSIDSLLSFINKLDNQYGVGKVGYSISSAIFNYDPNNKDDKGNVVKPTTATFKKIKKVVLDIDFYISGTKDRYALGFLDDTQIQFALSSVFLSISEKLRENNIEVIRPQIAGLTGSGLQIIFDLNREINKEEADIFFFYLKKIIGSIELDIILRDQLDHMTKVKAVVDTTFADIAHVQRVLGTINQKYNILSKYLDLFDDLKTFEEKIELIRDNYLDYIENAGFIISTKNEYLKYVNKIIDRVKAVILNESVSEINVDKYLQFAKMEQYSNKTMIKPSELKNIETELLYKLKEEGIRSVDIVRDDIKIDHESSKFIALKCPFHEDSKYSFAIYVNNTIDIFYDFHDSKSYTLITFWEKLHNVNKTTAISQIAQKAGIKLGRSERKDFQDLEIEEIIEHLLEKVNTEDYVYYRLANKNRVCVVRHKDSGEAFVFDGPRMVATHVLQNQLNVTDVDKKFLNVFVEKFQEKILIEAFEEFNPGKPTVFNKEFIKLVNLWVPSKNYKLSHDKAREIREELKKDDYDVEEALKLIQERTPWAFKYLQQITQSGNILWFINWLANSAKFNVMPVIPVVFGVPGVGKNLFISTIVEWYHNSEYTKILNSDRVMSNFNSMLESASMIVLDEGDISGSRDFDALKFLTGNDKIAIEKKGVDAQMKQRFFNIILFSNGETPVRHSFDDRRVQYFKTEKTLLQSTKEWGVSIEEFIKNVKTEMLDFWGILINTRPHKKNSISNEKDKIYLTQILKQHSFGDLILKLLNNEWQNIALQLNENVSDPTLMKANLEMLQEIKEQFQQQNKLSLTLINRYLNALNFKYKTSIQRFIQQNNLQEIGIGIEITAEDVLITIDKNKLKNLTKLPNMLVVKQYKRAVKNLIDLNSDIIEAEREMDALESEIDVEYNEDKPKIKESENIEMSENSADINDITDQIPSEFSKVIPEMPPAPPPAPDMTGIGIKLE